MLRLWLATGLLLTLAPLAAFAAERDILDSTSERPLGATINWFRIPFEGTPATGKQQPLKLE